MRILILFLSMVVIVTVKAEAWSLESHVRKGNRLFDKGQYADASEEYQKALKKDSESPRVNYNAGSAYYKTAHYDEAIEHLQKALLTEDPKFKRDVHFNLGNAFYAKARLQEETNPSQALENIENAKDQYQSALKLDDKDADAQYNYEVAKKKEEEIKKKMAQQKSASNKNQNQKKSKEDQNADNQQKQNEQKSSEQQKQDQAAEQNKQKSQDQNSQHKDTKASEENKTQESSESSKSQHQSDPSKNSTTEDQKRDQEISLDQLDNKNKDKTQHPDEKSDAKVIKPGQLTKEEAMRLLEQYEHSEAPEGLLKFNEGQSRDVPVLKDW